MVSNEIYKHTYWHVHVGRFLLMRNYLAYVQNVTCNFVLFVKSEVFNYLDSCREERRNQMSHVSYIATPQYLPLSSIQLH